MAMPLFRHSSASGMRRFIVHLKPTLNKSLSSTRSAKIRNSLVRPKFPTAKEGFSIMELDGRPLSWYSCGPTVYDDAHIGHARTYVCTDIIRRLLVDFHGFDVKFAMGITDIDDKIIERAKTNGLKSWSSMIKMVRDLEADFFDDLDSLNVRRPDAVLRVTEHIDIIIEYIQTIEKTGRTYTTADGVYFSVQSCGDEYMKFQEGQRTASTSPSSNLTPVEDADEILAPQPPTNSKRDQRDFVLWKSAKAGEPSWPSPWGEGRPGWHIECSAVTHSYFGHHLDIHSGGVDLKFPHHTNEIAQSEAHSHECLHHENRDWVGCWLHTGHLYIEGRKMSKSLKNFITIREYLNGDYSPHPGVDFRLFCLQHKYHSSVHFSRDRVHDAAVFRRKVENFIRTVDAVIANLPTSGTSQSTNSQNHSANNITHSTAGNEESPLSSQVKHLNLTNRKPTAESRRLIADLSACRSKVGEAFRNDFDTPEAVKLLGDLLGAGLRYAGVVATGTSSDTKGAGIAQPVEPLLAVANYVKDTLRLLGVDMDSHGDTEKTGISSSDGSSAEGIRSGPGLNTAAVDALVLFRSKVRTAGLKGMKALKQKKNNKTKGTTGSVGPDGGTTSGAVALAVEDNTVAIAAAREALGEVVAACDWVRDHSSTSLGIKIDDVGSDISTWRPDK